MRISRKFKYVKITRSTVIDIRTREPSQRLLGMKTVANQVQCEMALKVDLTGFHQLTQKSRAYYIYWLYIDPSVAIDFKAGNTI